MTIDQQIAALRAAGKLQEHPELAKIAAASAKAQAAINADQAKKERAEAEETERLRPTPFTLSLEPTRADDIAIVSLGRQPIWQGTLPRDPDGRIISPHITPTVCFAPRWFAPALDLVPNFARDGWFVCSPLQVIDMLAWYFAHQTYGIVIPDRPGVQVSGIEARRAQDFLTTVRGIQSTPLLLCIFRRLSAPGLHSSIAAAARGVRAVLSQAGHDPLAESCLHSQIEDRKVNEARADRIWMMVMAGGVTLPALPADSQTAAEQRANVALQASQNASQARLNGGAQ